MPILFSAVACERTILSHFASCDGNFMDIAELVLAKLPQCNNKMTYSHGTYLLHHIIENNYFYFCITDKLCQRSRTFLFLNEIQRRFMSNKKQTKEHFTTVLAAEMYRYSEDYNTITIRKGELDELNKIGVGCSEDLLGERILYVNNPENISYSTISYVGSTPERISVSIVSPRLYIVFIGVAILVIAMSVYMFGFISCGIVTGIGVYCLLCSCVEAEDKPS
ncbi:unnamed protein product [Arctia plantaginis]|uniref:Longin domain-containing protein n=1 Tax=Arctia plantaginis TaxID=874455 RepID=A0A8S1BCM5_ARCPL|nr:unnamed protein product [Arctia plantaginis]